MDEELERKLCQAKSVEHAAWDSTAWHCEGMDDWDDGPGMALSCYRIDHEPGVELSVSTLADQVTWATELLAPLVRAAKDRTLASKIMHLDRRHGPAGARS